MSRQRLLEFAKELEGSLSSESDRALAVISVAYLDHQISLALKERLSLPNKAERLLFEGFGSALGTFGGKIKMAEALELLSKAEIRNLNILRKIRNDFAHELLGLSFSTPKIAHRCTALELEGRSSTKGARERFQAAAFRLMVDLTVRIGTISPRSNGES